MGDLKAYLIIEKLYFLKKKCIVILCIPKTKLITNFQTNLSPADTVKAYVYQNEGASQNVTDATFAGFRIIPT